MLVIVARGSYLGKRAGAFRLGACFAHAGLAQLVEHLICNQGVGGSSPSAGTIKSMGYENSSILDRFADTT